MVAPDVVQLDDRDLEDLHVTTHRERAGTLSMRLVSTPVRSLWSVRCDFGLQALSSLSVWLQGCMGRKMRRLPKWDLILSVLLLSVLCWPRLKERRPFLKRSLI